MQYTFEHKQGNTKDGAIRLFSASTRAEAQHYAACHYDTGPYPFISEWNDDEAATYLTDGHKPNGMWREAFSQRDAKRLHVRDAEKAAIGSPLGYARSVAWWQRALAGTEKHAGHGGYRNPAPIETK